MLQSMSQIDNPGVSDAHAWMNKLNGEKFKNWEACLQYMRDNVGHHNLDEPRKTLGEFPFIRDFLDAMRTHAVCDYNLSVFMNDAQLTITGKQKGIGAAFNEAW